MNFVILCLHCLDMRDFHSTLRETPFLDRLRERSVFIPMGRAQGHHQGDSLIAELTGVWTARCCDSELGESGFVAPRRGWLPRTLIEHLGDHGYDLFTAIDYAPELGLGSAAADSGMRAVWLKHDLERRRQFGLPRRLDRRRLLAGLRGSKRFYAHLVLRETHRPWGQEDALRRLAGQAGGGLKAWLRRRSGSNGHGWPADASWARRAALVDPDGFAALRRKGLAAADRLVAEVFEAVHDRDDVSFVVYSNHGEVFDHFRGLLPFRVTEMDGYPMIEGTSHGNYPYEVAYANMQMWVIPGHPPLTMAGIGRLIDFAPTILDLAGVEPMSTDGESMLAAFASGRFAARDRYAEAPLGGGCLSMVRSDGLKLVSTGLPAGGVDTTFAQRGFPEHRLAVFDLESDPWEYVNLVHTPRGREVVRWAIARHRQLKETRRAAAG